MLSRTELTGTALVAALLIAAPVSAHPAPEQALVRGVVIDARSGDGVREARILLRGTLHTTVTDKDGRFAFADVRPGAYLLQVEHVAYLTRTDSIAITEGEDLILEVQIAETAIELEPLEVVARARKLVVVGFFERQSRGLGTYFTREEIEERGVQRMSDLLSRVPGLRRTVMSDGRSRIDVRGVKTITSRCDTQYFIDGIRAEIGVIGIDAIPPKDVEGIEIYRGASELPIQFDVGRAMCGAVLIWTRAGGR